MAEVIPFRGILYNAAKVSGGAVAAPPYDIITPEMRSTLYQKNPYNVVRIDSGEERDSDTKTDNKYTRALSYLEQWQREGILIRSPKSCFYAYEMLYQVEGKEKRLLGFFGLVRLVELGKGVYPHEETHAKPKIDRLNLTAACNANTSPIFSLYNSPEKGASRILSRIRTATPYIEAEDPAGALHRLWIIDAEDELETIAHDLRGKAVLIADGHHRYETALEYQKIMQEKGGPATGSKPYDYVLMFLANIADGDITILPTHRIITCSGGILDRLSGHFEIQKMPSHNDIINMMRGKFRTFGLCLKQGENQFLLNYKGEGLERIHPSLRGFDVTILHELIFKELLQVTGIHYEMDASRARAMVASGDYDAAFFLNPTRVEDVETVALSSVRMPPKSTYFYPKVMTGFIINSFT